MRLTTWSGSVIETKDYGASVWWRWALGWVRFWFSADTAADDGDGMMAEDERRCAMGNWIANGMMKVAGREMWRVDFLDENGPSGVEFLLKPAILCGTAILAEQVAALLNGETDVARVMGNLNISAMPPSMLTETGGVVEDSAPAIVPVFPGSVTPPFNATDAAGR